jgi:dethiobiotin synthetase
MNLFVTAIDTNIGKTVVSAILVEQLGWNYWKPIQSGVEEPTDTEKVQSLVTRKDITYYPETYRLTQPLSPHAAAKADQLTIQLTDIHLPQKEKLIIEGAGGVMVPLNEDGDCIIDLMKLCNCEAIIVSKNYLGSINHTLLTIKALQSRNISIKGIVIIGDSNDDSERIITHIGKYPIIAHIPMFSDINSTNLKSVPTIFG